MNTRILFTALIALSINPFVFGQMYGGGYAQPQSQPQQGTSDRTVQAPTKTNTTYPQGVKGYLDQQLAGSKDKKFHVSLNGKDVALSPVKFHEEKKLGGNKSAAAVEMKGADGKIYEINFVLSGNQVTGASVGKVNGKSPSAQ